MTTSPAQSSLPDPALSNRAANLRAISHLTATCEGNPRSQCVLGLFVAAFSAGSEAPKLMEKATAAALRETTPLLEKAQRSDSLDLRPAMGITTALGLATLLSGNREAGIAYLKIARTIIGSMKNAGCIHNSTEWLDNLLVLSGEHTLVTPKIPNSVSAEPAAPRRKFSLIQNIAELIKSGDITAAWLKLDETQDSPDYFLEAIDLAIEQQDPTTLFAAFSNHSSNLRDYAQDAFRVNLAVPLARHGASIEASACILGLSPDQSASVRRELALDVSYTIAAQAAARAT